MPATPACCCSRAATDGRCRSLPMTAICSPCREELAEVLVTPAQRVDLLLELDGRRERALSSTGLMPRRAPRALAGRDAVDAATARHRIAVDDDWEAAAGRAARSGGGQQPAQLQDGDGVHACRTAMATWSRSAGAWATLEMWEITNVDTQDHVFHLHTWPFQVWRRDGVEQAYPRVARHDQPAPGRAGRAPGAVPRFRRHAACSTAISPSMAMPG